MNDDLGLFNDLDDMISNNNNSSNNNSSNNNNNGNNITSTNSKPENYWDKTDISPLALDPAKFSKTGKSYAVYTFPVNDTPADSCSRILAMSKVATDTGYTFRRHGDKDNDLHNRIEGIEDLKSVSQIPWKSYNSNLRNPNLPTPEGYRIALTIHTAFMRMLPAVRAIIANDVNVLVGPDGTDPVDFVLAWSSGGDESLGRGADFKKIGYNSFMLQLASRANIPVINVFNDSSITAFRGIIPKVEETES